VGALRTSPAHQSVLKLAVFVAVGGAAGATTRALLETWWPATSNGWPWTTFAINLVGSFALGLLLETLVRSGASERRQRGVRLLLGTGALGGFTTYSTFVVEVERRLASGVVPLALTYLLVSVIAGLFMAGLGIVTADRLRRHAGGRSDA